MACKDYKTWGSAGPQPLTWASAGTQPLINKTSTEFKLKLLIWKNTKINEEIYFYFGLLNLS